MSDVDRTQLRQHTGACRETQQQQRIERTGSDCWATESSLLPLGSIWQQWIRIQAKATL